MLAHCLLAQPAHTHVIEGPDVVVQLRDVWGDDGFRWFPEERSSRDEPDIVKMAAFLARRGQQNGESHLLVPYALLQMLCASLARPPRSRRCGRRGGRLWILNDWRGVKEKPSFLTPIEVSLQKFTQALKAKNGQVRLFPAIGCSSDIDVNETDSVGIVPIHGITRKAAATMYEVAISRGWLWRIESARPKADAPEKKCRKRKCRKRKRGHGSIEDPYELIGMSIEKMFDGITYRGEVCSYDPACQWYMILYFDGDQEEMPAAEVLDHCIAVEAD